MAWTKAKTAIVAASVCCSLPEPPLSPSKKSKRIALTRGKRGNTIIVYSTMQTPQLAILPSRFGGNGGFGSSLGGVMGVGEPATSVVEAAYGWFNIPRIVVETKLPGGTYDFIASGPNRKALKDEVRKQSALLPQLKREKPMFCCFKLEIPARRT